MMILGLLLGSRGFVCVLVGRRMLSSREAMHSVASFKPLGNESWSRTVGAFSWSQEE